jgi:hypothetical protein
LLAGKLEEGWKRYEWRWQKADYIQYKREFAQPQWDGKDIKGKTICLHAEQGFGDAIQFIRYAPLVAKNGARVIVEAPYPLIDLFKTVEGIDMLVKRGDSLPDFDVHCPILTLPMLFKTSMQSIPASVPYIHSDPARKSRWTERLSAGKKRLKVGIAWSGNPDHKNDRNRSISFAMLRPIAEMPQVSLYSLQKGIVSSEIEAQIQEAGMIDYTGDIGDFADTAALIDNLDLIISVDTSVAHLAGALGKNVWVLLPYAPDWRWLLGRNDSPWYPTMRLYRQSLPGDWEGVVKEVFKDIK